MREFNSPAAGRPTTSKPAAAMSITKTVHGLIPRCPSNRMSAGPPSLAEIHGSVNKNVITPAHHAPDTEIPATSHRPTTSSQAIIEMFSRDISDTPWIVTPPKDKLYIFSPAAVRRRTATSTRGIARQLHFIAALGSSPIARPPREFTLTRYHHRTGADSAAMITLSIPGALRIRACK